MITNDIHAPRKAVATKPAKPQVIPGNAPPAGRSRLPLLIGAGVALIVIVALVAFLATGGFKSGQPDADAVKQAERDQRIADIQTLYSPGVVRKLVSTLTPKNKPGESSPGLKSRILVAESEVVDDAVAAKPAEWENDLRTKMVGSGDSPWQKLFADDAVKNAKLSPLTFDMPEETWPGVEKTVGTIVWLRWRKQAVGSYTGEGALAEAGTPADGGSKVRLAYKWLAVVAVLDRATSNVREVKLLAGENPPAKIAESAPAGTGKKPESLVRKYLLALPRE